MSTIEENARALRRFMELAVQDRPDEEAVQFICLYPAWKPGLTALLGTRYRYKDRLYKCLQTHQTQEDWTPDTTPSLFTEICESSAGTMSDPIPYNNNMELEKDKYYTQEGYVYLCTRSTGIPVYNALKDLLDIYVVQIN